MQKLQFILKKSQTSSIILALAFFVFACSDSPQTAVEPQSSVIKTQSKWLIGNDDDTKIHQIYYKRFTNDGRLALNIEYASNGNKAVESNYTYSKEKGTELRKVFGVNEEITKQESFSYLYNGDGLVTNKTSLDTNGNILLIINYKYDSEGNITKKEEKDLGVGSTKIYDYTYVKSDGTLTEFRVAINDGTSQTLLRDSISYNKLSKTVDKFNFDNSGSISVIYSYFYDLSGRLKVEVEKKPDGTVLRRYLYDYTFY